MVTTGIESCCTAVTVALLCGVRYDLIISYQGCFQVNFLVPLFPAVAHVQDCTFGTNKYGLPLSIIVGVNGESK